jgi:hypothetical protein
VAYRGLERLRNSRCRDRNSKRECETVTGTQSVGGQLTCRLVRLLVELPVSLSVWLGG